jgi:hypothetical protein
MIVVDDRRIDSFRTQFFFSILQQRILPLFPIFFFFFLSRRHMNRSLLRFAQFQNMLKWSPTSDDLLLRSEARLFRNIQTKNVSVPIHSHGHFINTIVSGPAVEHLSRAAGVDELRDALARHKSPPIVLMHGFGAGAGIYHSFIFQINIVLFKISSFL